MNVKGIIVEQLDWDGKSKSLTLQPDFSKGDLWVAFPTDYEEPRTGPFYFQNPNYEKQYNKTVAECRARKIPDENFFNVNGHYTFRSIWYNLPTERNALTYYALYLPEYAVLTSVDLYNPNNYDIKFKRTVLKDAQKSRYIVYLKCSSKHGIFNFKIECQFKKDKDSFSISNYSDEYQTDLYSNPDEWQYLMPEDQKIKTQKFFADQVIINTGTIEQTYKPNQEIPKTPQKNKFKWERGHKIALGSFIVALIVLFFGNNILGRFMSKDLPNENIFAKVNDVYYLTDSSKSETYPDAFKKDESGILIASDDITQSETMKMMWLDRKPIIRFAISNSNTTKSFKLIGVYLELNSKEYLLKISTQYDKDEPFICPPNSNIEYVGVPLSYPVYRIEKNLLHLESNPEEAQKLYPLYIQPTKPVEISGRLIIQFEDSTAMIFNQPFRINKKVIKDLKPNSSL